jgi:hypothetical protein
VDANPCSPFETLETTFRLLGSGSGCLALDGRRLRHGLPARPIPLLELRALLQHPTAGDDLRSAVLEELVHRATRQGGRWMVALAGVLLPGLRLIAASVACVDRRAAAASKLTCSSPSATRSASTSVRPRASLRRARARPAQPCSASQADQARRSAWGMNDPADSRKTSLRDIASSWEFAEISRSQVAFRGVTGDRRWVREL